MSPSLGRPVLPGNQQNNLSTGKKYILQITGISLTDAQAGHVDAKQLQPDPTIVLHSRLTNYAGCSTKHHCGAEDVAD